MKFLFSKIFFLALIGIFSNCTKNNQTEIESSNEWTQRANIPTEELRISASIVTYNNEAYLLPGKGGTRFSSKPEILKYSNDEWTRVATYDGFAMAGGSRSIRNNDVIYILGGVNRSNAPTDEVRAFSITTNSFSEETRFSSAISATYTQTKAYFGNNEEFFSYDFTTNTTESLPLTPSGLSILSALTTTENNIIYALFIAQETDNFYAFNESLGEWIQLADFPGGSRSGASIVSTSTDIYAGLGNNPNSLFDILKYNIETNEWDEFSEYPGTHFSSGFAFELNNELFFGGGFTGSGIISNELLNEEIYSLKVE